MVGRSSFPANCGDAAPARLPYGVDRRKHELFSDGAKYEVAIPAVPLRSLPDRGMKLGNATGDTVHKKDELLKRESDKLAALISEANEFMNLLNARNPRSMEHQSPSLESDAFDPCTSSGEQKLILETDGALAASVMPQDVDRNFYAKRLKINRDNAKPPIGKWDKDIESEKKCLNTMESQQINIDLVSDGTESESDLDIEKFPSERDEDAALKTNCVGGECIATNSNDEAEYCENQHDHPQKQPSSSTNVESKKGKFEVSNHSSEICVSEDLSRGKEKFKVRVMNGVDESLPPPFNYITNIVYPPNWFQWCVLTDCNCIDGCSDTVQCPCIAKNGDEIAFNGKGLLTRARTKNVIHECGTSCKCPPSCMNRVSQHGPRFQLEIFKTKLSGWGVRSRDYIVAGSFICEYIGELVGEKEASQRIGNDEYLFDISHGKSKRNEFALDAAKYGNIGRFINHSCDPNVFAQKVVFGDEDDRVPHIMFFAGKRIPIGTELRYDYNYSSMRVYDANGNIKRKPCYCGSRKCSGRLY